MGPNRDTIAIDSFLIMLSRNTDCTIFILLLSRRGTGLMPLKHSFSCRMLIFHANVTMMYPARTKIIANSQFLSTPSLIKL